MSNPQETWKDIPGYEGHYQASDLGRIKSLSRVTVKKNGAPMSVKEKILSNRAHRHGYSSYVLRKDGKSHPFHGHVLVMRAFKGMPDPGLIICHNDSDGSNNQLENLRYDTVKSNSADMIAMGKSMRGERSPSSILTEETVLDIRNRRARGERLNAIAKHYGITASLVGLVARGITWKHLGGSITLERPKVTESQVVAIRYLRSAGASVAHLATTYGISRVYAQKICAGDLWKNAPGPITRPSLNWKTNRGAK